MTTYTLDAYFYRPDSMDAGQDFAFSELAIALAPGAGPLRYTYDAPQVAGSVTPVTLDGVGLYNLLFGGGLIANDVRVDSVVAIDWGAGQTSVAYQVDVEAGAGRYLVFLGGDPVALGDAAAFASFVTSVTSVADVTSGPFVAGALFDPATLPGVRVSEDDVIIGTIGPDTLLGGPGADMISGLDGDDLLDPGTPGEQDSLLAGSGNDTVDLTNVTGGSVALLHYDLDAGIRVDIGGPDTPGSIDKGVNGSTTLAGLVTPERSVDLVIGGTFSADEITIGAGYTGIALLQGLEGGDTFVLPDAPNRVTLAYDDPRITSGITADLATGVIANDGFGFTDTVSGQVAGVSGTALADDITGSDLPVEVYVLLGGDDTLDGAGGHDVVSYDQAGMGAVSVDLGAGTATGTWTGQAFVHSLRNVEGVMGSDQGDMLRGGAEGSDLSGGNGDDTLNGGAGNDTLSGGAGTDIAILNVALTEVVVRAQGSGVQIESALGRDDYAGDIELFQFTDGLVAYGDLPISAAGQGLLLVGDAGPDLLEGTSGNDTLAGLGGNDTLRGNAGDDALSGSDGNDDVSGGDGADGIGGGLGDDTLSGDDGNDTIGSGQGDDSASGGTGDDIVNGGAGNDTLSGGDGDDTMGAGQGTDSVDGGAGNDSLGGGTGRDTLLGGSGDDRIGAGEGDDSVLGGSGADFLAGGGRNDMLDGGTGADTLNGGAGDDTLTGGSGADIFVFNDFAPGEVDRITDFQDGSDVFRLSGVENAPGSGLQGRIDALNISDALLDGPDGLGQAGVTLTYRGHVIEVVGVSAADLDVGDFVFV